MLISLCMFCIFIFFIILTVLSVNLFFLPLQLYLFTYVFLFPNPQNYFFLFRRVPNFIWTVFSFFIFFFYLLPVFSRLSFASILILADIFCFSLLFLSLFSIFFSPLSIHFYSVFFLFRQLFSLLFFTFSLSSYFHLLEPCLLSL